MREVKDNTYASGLNESGLRKTEADDEDDYLYFRLKRELIVSNINTNMDNLDSAYLTPKYNSLFPNTYLYNTDFWINLNTTVIDKLELKLLDDLGEGLPLEKQFILNQNN